MENHERKLITNRAIILLGFLSLSVLIRSAWIGDDSFITMRTVDNWINGFGLTWNTSERVQAYTHPLWMVLLSAFHVFVRDGYYTMIVICIVTSMIVFALFLKHFSGNLFSMAAGWGILVLSKSFVDYSTSGLENPLTHALLLLFYIAATNQTLSPARKLLFMGCLAGLGATNRIDLVLLFLPALAYYWLKEYRNFRGLMTASLGFLPFILWEIFSLIYYGFPFPNSAYAKLNTSIPHGQLFEQGVDYFINSIQWDPITLLVVLLSVSTALVRRDPWNKTMAAGIGLYLLYILYIGGDFMSGRFFSGTLLLGAVLFAAQIHHMKRLPKLILTGGVLLTGILNPASPLTYFWTKAPADPWSAMDAGGQISDERGFYLNGTGLFDTDGSTEMPNHSWAMRGQAYKQEGKKVIVEDTIGMIGYFAGPDIHIIDTNALGDPLLARLKVSDTDWRIGHFAREIPEGYEKTLARGENKIEDACLAEYYDKLATIIKGPLFSRSRVLEIWKMNTGQYETLLECYQSGHK